MHEQRKDWESYAFAGVDMDEDAIEEYLNDLFETSKQKKHITSPLKTLQESFSKFDQNLNISFDSDTVAWCIKGVIKSDLFAGKKRKALQDLLSQPAVLSEMADVLNMDLESLETWEWDPSPVPMEMRRQLNGKYRVFMDYELHQAILIHNIGARWAVYMKNAFRNFLNSWAWSWSPQASLTQKDKSKRQFYLGDADKFRRMENNKIAFKRKETYKDDFFMLHLPSSVEEGVRDYGDQSSGTDNAKSIMDIKQSLLHTITTEALIFTKIYGHCNVLQSDFKWFGPSLPHPTMFAVLKFFGVSEKWLNFFKKFLEAPLIFKHDGKDAEATTRQRGIPICHALSDALGEAVLFCLDFAINKKTTGSNLYRFHDDLWFWGKDAQCVLAWKELKLFSNIMGLHLNEEKTGNVRLGDGKVASELPTGPVRWGFLMLDTKTSSWIIDKAQVDEHIKELQLQLAAKNSVFAWVQAFNSYVNQFFTNNFGKPSNCFGQQHVRMVIETFTYIQRKLFADGENSAGNVTEHLRSEIKKRFGVDNIPDGFFYLPVELGGLELRNPFIPLFSITRQVQDDPMKLILQAIEEEEEEYSNFKKTHDDGSVNRGALSRDSYAPTVGEGFISFEEFTKAREETSIPMLRAYERLLQMPSNDEVVLTPGVSKALDALSGDNYGHSGFSDSWHMMQPYWKWVCELYAADVMQRFGGLSMGERELLPIGLVSMLRSEKVRWQG